LFKIPSLALILGLVIAILAVQYPGVLDSYWLSGFVKGSVFCIVFIILHIIFERENKDIVINMIKIILPNIRKKTRIL
jgi:hypothetical protein